MNRTNEFNVKELLKIKYNEQDNYKIVDISNEKECFIFCSSNNLLNMLSRNNSEEFINDDYYEWVNIAKNDAISKHAGKIIYLRDVFCRTYVNGINKKINSIDKIIRFLKEVTKGYKITCVGYSAGGYLSMILGASLDNVKRVYSFGGLVSLYKWTGAKDDYSFEDVDEYVKHQHDTEYSKWYDIIDLIKNYKSTLVYSYGLKNNPDLKQLELIKNINNPNVLFLGIDTKRHGGDFYGFVYPKFLVMGDSKLKKCLKKGEYSKTSFGIKSMGLFSFGVSSLRRLLRKR